MTRINTNVPSLVAQNRLQESNGDLQQSLTRLSTGLRINKGSDDPAGLIASEALRSEITGLNKALSNTRRADQIVSTADSALSQVSNLLNDIRGLVVEAANSGALSDSEIAANQLQVDSSLEAINRIAQTTTFQGRKLLDGSLGFNTTEGNNFDRLSNLKIDQANLGASGSVSVNIEVETAATTAQVDLTNIPAATTAANAVDNLSFTNAAVQSVTDFSIGGQTIALTAQAAGTAAGAEGNEIAAVAINYGAGTDDSSYDAATNTLTINTQIADGVADIDDIITSINGGSDFTTVLGGATGTELVETADIAGATFVQSTNGRDAGSATIRVQADDTGTTANGVSVSLINEGTGANTNTASAAFAANGTDIEVTVSGTVSYTDIATAIDGLAGYNASVTASTGDANLVETVDTNPTATLAGGASATGGLAQAAVFQVTGSTGSEVFNFDAGTSISQVSDAINLVSDATGVSATINGTTLELNSSTFGSNSVVDVQLISEAAGGTIRTAIGEQARDTGSDVVANVNGVRASGDGNKLSINTATLDLTTSVSSGQTGISSFTIDGGGALFQLGSSVVSNQQARIGIDSVNTGSLGGVNGRLFELGSGQAKALSTDADGASKVIDEVIDQVTNLRGRLGAFQKTTLETNINSINDTVANLQEAESSIRDADFAAESAALTRAQILVQSGTSVLTLANQNPQNVLSLLG